jgi:3-oxoacyl-[acyl-carrier-protein] synthase-1
LSTFDSRNTRLALASLVPLQTRVTELVERYGRQRVAVVAGTSTSGIAEGEAAVKSHKEYGHKPKDYHYARQEIGNLGEFVARHFSLAGPAYTLSTACSSSAHALGSARRLLDSGVVAGGTDSLCRLTVNGFSALESVAAGRCSPFSRHRSGINIGEASAFFVVTREPVAGSENIRLLGVGASSDAHHISAPEPNGTGAETAIRQALRQAVLPPQAISYVNLHGTGTPLNDRMEAGVIARPYAGGGGCDRSGTVLAGPQPLQCFPAAAASYLGW